MEDQLSENKRPAWASVLFILLTLLAGFVFIGPAIGFMLALPSVDGTVLDFATKLANPVGHPELKIPLYILQASGTFVGLAVVPGVYCWRYEHQNPRELLRPKSIPLLIGFAVILIVLSFMVTDSVVIDWNAHFRFPDFLKGFETWARKNETLAEQLTTFFTTFDSPSQFLIGFFVIAILAGFSEEFVFRGLLQPQLYRATGNIHAAIWICAFLFSALHMQFFGFVPRLLLGALFGYLYYWSGNLYVPMFAHVVNNGFSVVLLYLKQLGKVDFDVEGAEPAPWPMVILFSIFTAGLLFYFYRYYRPLTQQAS